MYKRRLFLRRKHPAIIRRSQFILFLQTDAKFIRFPSTQGGSDGEDRAEGVSASEDGRVVVVGYTDGYFGGGNTSAGEIDFVAVMLGVDGASYPDDDSSAGSDGGGTSTSAGGGGGTGTSSSSSHLPINSDSSTSVGDGGDTGVGDSGNNNTSSTSGGLSGNESGILVGGLAAVVLLGVFLIGLGWAWRKRKGPGRPDTTSRKWQAKRSSKHPDAARSVDGNGGGFDLHLVGDDTEFERRPRQEQGSSDGSSSNAFAVDNPLFGHRNCSEAPDAVVSGAASGVSEEGGGGGGGNGSQSSWEDRRLTSLPGASASDDVSRWVQLLNTSCRRLNLQYYYCSYSYSLLRSVQHSDVFVRWHT